nr:MAG TPA: hypothetical protein [Caudoviricetes sp.]
MRFFLIHYRFFRVTFDSPLEYKGLLRVDYFHDSCLISLPAYKL